MNNKIIKLRDWDMTKDDEVFYYNATNKKLVYDKDNFIIIKGGRKPFINLIESENFIKTLNYFEKFYDKENVLTGFYTEMVLNIDKNICKDDFISVINTFVISNNEMIENMNQNNMESEDVDAKKFMKLSLVYKLIIPIVNYYLYKQEGNAVAEMNIVYDIFNSILNLIDEDIHDKISDSFSQIVGYKYNELLIHDIILIIVKFIIYTIPKYQYDKDYRVLNYSFFKQYCHMALMTK